MAQPEANSPVIEQIDGRSIDEGETDLYEVDEFIQIEIFVEGDILVHFLDNGGDKTDESLRLSTGEEYHYNFGLNKPPDIQIEGQQDGTLYDLLIQHV